MCVCVCVLTHVCNLISIADQAIRAMNRKEKDIVRAYYRALKYATHKEFRTRVFLIGDCGTGQLPLSHTHTYACTHTHTHTHTHLLFSHASDI